MSRLTPDEELSSGYWIVRILELINIGYLSLPLFSSEEYGVLFANGASSIEFATKLRVVTRDRSEQSWAIKLVEQA